MDIKGARYIVGNPRRYLDGARFIVEEVLFFDWEGANRFYEKFESYNPDLNDRAILGCNDRFYLLTRLLNRKDANHPWLYDRCREVEFSPFGFIDLWSRYHYKSTIITFAGSIQGILCDPELTIGLFSATNKIARPFLTQIKQEFEANERLKQVYSDVLWENPKKQAPKWSVEGGIVVKRQSNPKEATVEAYGALDGMPTGRHFKRLTFDDLLNQEHVTNPEMIQKVTERWELSESLGCGEGTQINMVGTRYSFADTYGIVLERQALKPRIYPATDNGRLDGRPVFLTQKHWETVKNKQRSTVSAQMLQNPVAGKENMFRPEWFVKWEVRPTQLSIYVMVDPSGGRSKKSDRCAMAVVGVDGAGNKYFLDGFRHRMSLTERWQALKLLFLKWSRERGVVHFQVGYEKYGMQADLEYIKEKQLEQGCEFAIKELNWPNEGGHSKTARVGRLEPETRMGRLYLPALVHEPGKGDCYWHVDEKSSMIVRIPAKGQTSLMQRANRAGLDHLICKSIKRIDEDRKPYDVTMCLMEEMLFFPFAPKDDLVDATSRIYDMDVRIPDKFEEMEATHLNERDWIDA